MIQMKNIWIVKNNSTFMKKRILLMITLLCFLKGEVFAQFQNTQTENVKQNNKWFFGISEGWHTNSMKYSNLDESLFPDKRNLSSGVFSLFIQRNFGKEHQFSLRPEITFLKRGGKLTHIGEDLYDYEENELKDFNYQLKSHYLDIRIPVIYNFGKYSSTIRPYIYVAPILGIPTNGNIRMETQYHDNYYDGYSLTLSNANIATYYFAASAAIGLKYMFKNSCFLGIEASYEYGFTDTYSQKEKAGKVETNSDIFPEATYIDGTRKFSGFEIKATLGIPFSIFKKKPVSPQTVAPSIITTVIRDTVFIKEKPCYTLEEITELVERNQSVIGKTICAIDLINFDFGKSSIKEESFEYLDKVASILIKTNAHVEIKGHTDNVGTEEFNLKLSKERAQAVAKYLESKGVHKDKLTFSYYGMSQPLSTNDTEEGRTMNRRVEFEILSNQ